MNIKPSLLLPSLLGSVFRVHVMSVSLESDVRVFLFGQGFLFGKGNCFSYTTQDGLVSHPSNMALKCQRSNHNTGSADCSVRYCPQTGTSAS